MLIWTDEMAARAKAALAEYATTPNWTEEWRPLWSDYEVSSNGRVRGPRGLLKLHKTKRGNTVRLHTIDGVKNFRVAELVAGEFGKKDFRPALGRGGNFKLTTDEVEWIRYLGTTDMKQQEIADLFGIGRVHCCNIINRRVWRHLA